MDETIKAPRLSFFSRLVNYLKKLFTVQKVAPIELISKFKMILDEINPRSPEYEYAYNTVILCEEALRITRQRILHAEKIKGISEKMAEVECFDALTEDESKRLQNLLTHYLSLSKERTALMHQITGFDASLSHILKLEEDAGQTALHVGEAEEYRRILKQDLGYLGGEKAELEYEREFLEKGQDFIRKFSIVMVSIFAIVTIVYAFLHIFQNTQILFPISVMTVLLLFVLLLLFMFRRRLNYELMLNFKKQERAVKLLNKKTAVFAHYTNYLNFVYKKYRVRNSQMLKKNIKDVQSYKHLTGRIDNIRNIMYQTQDQIEEFLRKKNFTHMSTSAEHFAQTINVEDKKQYYLELSKERQTVEKALKSLDRRHEEIWDYLIEQNDADYSENGITSRIIQTYLEEAEKVFTV